MRPFFPAVSLREICDFPVWWALSGVAPPAWREALTAPHVRQPEGGGGGGGGEGSQHAGGSPGQSRTSLDPPAVPSVLFTSPGMVCALFLSFTEHPKSPSLISPDEVRKMLAPREKWAVVSLWNTRQVLWSLGGDLNHQELDSQHYKDWWKFTRKALSLERF